MAAEDTRRGTWFERAFWPSEERCQVDSEDNQTAEKEEDNAPPDGVLRLALPGDEPRPNAGDQRNDEVPVPRQPVLHGPESHTPRNTGLGCSGFDWEPRLVADELADRRRHHGQHVHRHGRGLDLATVVR